MRPPARVCITTLASIPRTPSHETTKEERFDGVGPRRLAGISSSFRALGKDGLLPVFDECSMVHEDS